MGGLLSHNLFTYCRNNPVSFSDPDGNVVLYMLEVAFYGIFHQMIQTWIVLNNKGARPEVHPFEGSKLRIDILYKEKIYEIKPDNATAIACGKRQVKLYENASNGVYSAATELDSLKLPDDYSMNFGTFSITIKVRRDNALILYNVDVERHGPTPAIIPVPGKEMKKTYEDYRNGKVQHAFASYGGAAVVSSAISSICIIPILINFSPLNTPLMLAQ